MSTFWDITVTNKNDHDLYIFAIKGDMSSANEAEVAAEINDFFAQNQATLETIFDLTHCNYLNSTAIGYFMNWYVLINGRAGKMALTGVTPDIHDLLESQGVLDLIPLYTALESGVEALTK